MSSPTFPATLGIRAPDDKPWFHKNWKWFVPVLAAAVLIGIGGFILGILLFVNSAFAHSYPYRTALQLARSSIEVSEQIGRPLTVGWLTTGQLNYVNNDGDVSLRIPISGPRGRGTIVVIGKKRAARWTFDTLEVDVHGQSIRIPLQAPSAPTNPATFIPNTT